MLRKSAMTLISAICLWLPGTQTSAHHSFAAEFDRDRPIELTGIVTKVEWTAPHVWFYVNVRDEMIVVARKKRTD